MCGIFGVISSNTVDKSELMTLAKHAKQRGRDSSGLVLVKENSYDILRADHDILKLIKDSEINNCSLIAGHSRLVTNGHADNQPVVRDDTIVLHNGIIVNDEEIWNSVEVERKLKIDSEILNGIALEQLNNSMTIQSISERILTECKGVIACALFLPSHGKALLFSNNGSLYTGEKNNSIYFSSEKFPLSLLGCSEIKKIINETVIIDIPQSSLISKPIDIKTHRVNLVPSLGSCKQEEALLSFEAPELKRCTKCILPETMPFITFDTEGVCNYCHNYTPRNIPRPKEELFNLVEKYRRVQGDDCLVPFSGGRDSCYGLHLISKELKMKPIAYTYDWGMVTDLGRRNISRMCSKLGVENIIIAADITKKRNNITKNLSAWLESPHLGLMSLLTAGDKHFFRHLETVKKQTGIGLNLWGVNPLEVTHFKTGFLDIAPDFVNKGVYVSGLSKQLNYQKQRFKAMLGSSKYFNSSLLDTLSGEYHRSVAKKTDYFHIFDYWRWDENEIDDTLLNTYEWEKAIDTPTTWRIGDGTAAFYNYVYHTVAGFTEHDTFRSNQIREGDLTREEALKLVNEENRARYPNIKWYLDTLGLDYKEAIQVVNSIPKLYGH